MATSSLIPVSNGDYDEFLITSGCVTAWECLDDPVGAHDGLTSYLQGVLNERQSVLVGSYTASAPAERINSVTVTSVKMKAAGGAATIRNFL